FRPWRPRSGVVAPSISMLSGASSLAESPPGQSGHVLAGQVSEGEGWADGRSASWIGGAEHTGGGVAGGVEPSDHTAVIGPDPGVGVDAWSPARSESAVVEAKGIERRRRY